MTKRLYGSSEEVYRGLSELRKEHKLTQQELADKVNLSREYISKIENGQIEPSDFAWRKICIALGANFSEDSFRDLSHLSEVEKIELEADWAAAEYLMEKITPELFAEYDSLRLQAREVKKQKIAALNEKTGSELFEVWDKLSEEDKNTLRRIANGLAEFK